MGELGVGKDGNKKDQVGERGMKGESTGRDNWNWGTVKTSWNV